MSGGKVTPLGSGGLELGRWTTEDLVGQVVMAGFHGRALRTPLEEMLHSGRVGNVILFSRNLGRPEDVAALTQALQQAALASPRRVPLLVATDQEGGSVTRLWEGATRFPGNMALGAAGDPGLARRVGLAMGRELASVGINMDLAPVLDANSNPANPVIGTRSFGDDPDRVAELGASFIQGLQEGGVAACAKHFPGHGDTSVDSHLDLPVVPHDRDRLEAVELRPFRAAVEAGVLSIMTAHVHFPAVEPEPRWPATLSTRCLEGLLRGELGFEGVIITDCLEMKAISAGTGTVEGAVQALAAGADLLLISHTWELQLGAVEAIKAAVEGGRVPRRRLEEAAGRVLALKERLGLLTWERGDAAHLPARRGPAGLAGGKAVAEEAARRAVTLLGSQRSLPFDPSLPTLVVEVTDPPRGNSEEAGREAVSLAETLARLLPGVEGHRLSSDGLDEALPAVLQAGRQAPQSVVVTRNAIRDAAQQRMVQALAGAAPNLVGVALASPYDVALFPQVCTWILAYSDQPPSVRAAADVLAGRLRAEGRMPVRLKSTGPL